MKPTKGDRVLIKGIPANHPRKGIYGMQKDGVGLSVVGGSSDNHINVATGYTPYKYKDHFELSGCYHYIPEESLTFLHNAPAPFWRFKKNERRAHNAETYYENVNWFEVDFKHVNK